MSDPETPPSEPAPATPHAEVSKDARNWGMFCHLAAFSGVIIPFGHLVGPLVVWLIKKDEFEYVDYNGKEALNFQLSMTLWGFIAALMIFVVIGVFLVPALILLDLILLVIATIKTSNGERFRYPLTIRFIS